MNNGLATMSGDILVEPQYSAIETTPIWGIWRTHIYGGSTDPIRYNFIDRNGNRMFKEDFTSYVDILNKNRFIHKSGDKFGLIDRDLNVIVAHEYPDIRNISVDRIAIRKDTGTIKMEDYLYGLYDSDGNVILPMEYENIWGESEGFIAVQKNGKVGFVDRDGNLKIGFINARKVYGYLGFIDGMAAIVTHRFPPLFDVKFLDKFLMLKTTVINTKGEILFSTTGGAFSYSQGVFLIYKGKGSGFVLVTRSGDAYPLPKHIFSDGADLSVLLNDGVIRVPVVERRYGGNDSEVSIKAYGLLKFTIKEK